MTDRIGAWVKLCLRIAPTITAETFLRLLRRSIRLLRCGFTPVYALLGRFLPRLKAASGRPPFWR
jgi:hypothetical protein